MMKKEWKDNHHDNNDDDDDGINCCGDGY